MARGNVLYPIMNLFFVSLTLFNSITLATSNPSFLPQGFMFDWNSPGEPVPIPTTEQCETIHLTWSRGTVTGPNPTAPYYMLIYASTFIVPFSLSVGSGLSFDWQVPFAPGTQYQICMFDANGVSGGCEAIYTVIPASNASAANPVSCPNVTFPAGAMDVVGAVENGALSQYGWINQCTDLSLTPRNGTPPYTMTVAPALHPPVNITSNSMDPMNWTVSLSWASPFFVSVVDSEGNSWANGPLHSGGDGPTACLALGAASSSGVPVGAVVGAIVGAFVGGAVMSLAAFYVMSRRQGSGYGSAKQCSGSLDSPTGDEIRPGLNYKGVPCGSGLLADQSPPGSPPVLTGSSRDSAYSYAQNNLAHRLQRDGHYHVEPFLLPPLHHHAQSSDMSNVSSVAGASPSPSPPETPERAGFEHRDRGSPSVPALSSAGSSVNVRSSQVFVMHHDGGQAPVSVLAPEGTEVVELPPRYADSGTDQQRRPLSTTKRPLGARAAFSRSS